MKIGLIQYSPEWENKKKNREKINAILERDFSGHGLLILPEMTLTGFTMNTVMLSEQLEGESFRFYSGISKKYNADVLAGLIEEDNGNFYNTLLHINTEGELKASYRKIHPFSYSTEDKNYKRGNKTVITKVKEFNTGLSICYDLRFPELFRQYGKAGAELIVVIANWPDTRIEHWRTLLKARAIENQCYVAGVNRVGNDPKLSYPGYTSVFDPLGIESIFEVNTEKIVDAEISKDRVEEVREKLPFLNDIFLV